MLIDTHLHLGGCIPPEFVWNVVSKDSSLHYMAESYEDVYSRMTFADHEPRNFHRFLDKFRILDEIKWTEELIDESIEYVCNQLKQDQVDFAWIDLSLNKYMEIGWHKKDALLFINNSFKQRMPGQYGLLLSLKYESSRTGQKQHAKLIDDADLADCLFGIDLVGDEAYFDHAYYAPIFKEWNSAGKITRAHVGESQTAVNVKHAIEHLKVSNIAHGVKISEHHDLLSLASDSGVVFDLAITSNYITGIVGRQEQHPIFKMLDRGIKITIGSDDPIQCNTSISKEYEILESMGVPKPSVEAIKAQAIDATTAAMKRQNLSLAQLSRF